MSAVDHTESSAPPAEEKRGETVLLEWTIHLLRRDSRRLCGIVGAAFLAALLGLFFFFHWAFAAVGALLVLGASQEFLFPLRYRLTDRRACVSYGLVQLDLPWERVRRVMDNGESFRLSIYPGETRMEAFRGITLRYAPEGEPGSREQVLDVIRERAPEALKRREDESDGGGE